MANITINEVSQNYTYNIGTNSYCTVALPITACWGPGFMPTSIQTDDTSVIEAIADVTEWQKFPATQAGLESFVAAYRGPAANYRSANDFSYQMAMTLLTSGYDVLVCRLCPGSKAVSSVNVKGVDPSATGTLTIEAKYPGSFGNTLKIAISTIDKKGYKDGQPVTYTLCNLVISTVDSVGSSVPIENISFVLDQGCSTDSLPYVEDVSSKFVTLSVHNLDDVLKFTITESSVQLTGGQDSLDADSDVSPYAIMKKLYGDSAASCSYLTELKAFEDANKETKSSKYKTMQYKACLYYFASLVYPLLTDKLAYNPNRIIIPGWDDQNTQDFGETIDSTFKFVVSPLQKVVMDTAYNSRCATALLDIPKQLPKSQVHNETSDDNRGYAQMLSEVEQGNPFYATHSALFAPWGQYTYVGTGKQNAAPPSFLGLLIQRAMILNQSIQYEWTMPTNRKHNLSIGKMDYTVKKHDLDTWQKLDGVSVNVVTQIPDLGTTIWGNSTLYNVPPATYQALANLSTRYLVNAIENVAYRAGLSITFQYNNDDAYSKFYAAVTPILDTMKNAGAIDSYYVKMAADINGLDQVNANSVIGTIYLVINGVINDITVDLIALPPGTDLSQFQG